MRRIKVLSNVISFLILAIILQSCATIFGGRGHTLVFESEKMQQAEVYVDDALIGSAPGKIRVQKGTIQHGSTLEIRSEGFETEQYLILLKPHAAYVVADFAVGAVPLIVDFATGDILRPKPRKFLVDMEAAAEQSEEVKPEISGYE